MVRILTARARAYVLRGDWVADCTRPGCGGAEHLYDPIDRSDPDSPRVVRKPEFRCSYCGTAADIEWPGNLPEIMEVLMLRPVPHTRNWYPPGHEGAVRLGIEHGQTVDDLRAENVEHGVPAGPKGSL